MAIKSETYKVGKTVTQSQDEDAIIVTEGTGVVTLDPLSFDEYATASTASGEPDKRITGEPFVLGFYLPVQTKDVATKLWTPPYNVRCINFQAVPTSANASNTIQFFNTTTAITDARVFAVDKTEMLVGTIDDAQADLLVADSDYLSVTQSAGTTNGVSCWIYVTFIRVVATGAV